jgi:pimeloyl-ACP methyl ester carboxylesterase
MATYALIHGAGDSWYWHLTVPELLSRGHEVVAPDLPSDDSAGLSDYADAVVQAIGDRRDVIVVAQSLGGFTGPLVCDRIPVDLLVLVAAMIPVPGERVADWGAGTGADEARRAEDARAGRTPGEFDPLVTFFHDVPPEVTAEGMSREQRNEPSTAWNDPWPLKAWPDVPTRFLLCRDDRLFPAAFMRRVVRERLGIVPDEIDGGHLPALANPRALVDRLEAYRAEVGR